MDKFYRCSCFFERNYFSKHLNRHVTFKNKEQFTLDHQERFGDLADVISELETEKERRLNEEERQLKRSQVAKQNYRSLHADVLTSQVSHFEPEFLAVVDAARNSTSRSQLLQESVLKEISDNVSMYTLPVFTAEFCRRFVAELKNYEKSPLEKSRPNTMNDSGLLLSDLNMYETFIDPLVKEYLAPLTSILFPDYGGANLDSYKAFVVSYSANDAKPLSSALAYHYDNAEVTLNVSLSDTHDDGELYFGGMRNEEVKDYIAYKHRLGYGLLHRGQHQHGAMPISDGERYNLIIWMRSSQIRNQLCPMCDLEPALIPSSGYGDGFTKRHVDVCSLV